MDTHEDCNKHGPDFGEAAQRPVEALVSRDDFEVSQFRDGSLVLSCGKDGMESDLVFASGAMAGDPALDKQAAILDFIIRAVNAFDG